MDLKFIQINKYKIFEFLIRNYEVKKQNKNASPFR